MMEKLHFENFWEPVAIRLLFLLTILGLVIAIAILIGLFLLVIKLPKDKLSGQVGPKNVYGVKGNQYFDSDGKPTNGATTGPHLHLGIRIDGKYMNPLNYF